MTSDNNGLQAACQALVSDCDGLNGRLLHKDTMHVIHVEFADRVTSFSSYLKAALALTVADQYAPTFAVLRSAMEHHLVDLLLFRGHRYTVIIPNVSKEKFAEWQASLESGDLGPDVQEIRRRGRDAEIVRTGIHYTDGEKGPGAPSVSQYYTILEQFDPFTGGLRAQPFIGEWRYRAGDRNKRVQKQAEIWKRSLSWDSLLKNIALNDFYTETELARWQVHYAFLSAFAHPVSKRSTESLYGHNMPVTPRADHYAVELALLYVGTLASLELQAFDAMRRREPPIAIQGRDTMIARADAFRTQTAYFWFPSGSPDNFDRVQEANQRGVLPDFTMVPREERRPDLIPEAEVKYYDNPLRRLIEMHGGISEMFGFHWGSPWPRPDAWQRRMDT
jgi:hypothetical protein